MNLFKQKFQRSHCSNSLLPEVLSSPQQQSRRGGAELQHFRQSALKACYSLFSFMVLFLFYVSNKSRLLEHCFGVFCLLFLKCPFIERNENIWKQEQNLNASKKQEEAVKCDRWNQIPFVFVGCNGTENRLRTSQLNCVDLK